MHASFRHRYRNFDFDGDVKVVDQIVDGSNLNWPMKICPSYSSAVAAYALVTQHDDEAIAGA